MKTLKYIIAIALLCTTFYTNAQDNYYVSADSGLTVREKPDVSAAKINKLRYAEKIEVVENTKIKLVVVDEGKQIAGEWVKIKMIDFMDNESYGYVFNGYLSSEKIARTKKVTFSDLDIHIKNLAVFESDEAQDLSKTDTAIIYVDIEDSPENKIITIKNSIYKNVKVLQRYENSITIMNEGPHCDLTEWKHYYSEWKPIRRINSSKFEMLGYSKEDATKFETVSIDELKKAVSEECSETWTKLIENVKTVNDYPSGVGMSRVFLKFILTDYENNITEKMIAFEIPMGC